MVKVDDISAFLRFFKKKPMRIPQILGKRRDFSIKNRANKAEEASCIVQNDQSYGEIIQNIDKSRDSMVYF